MAPTGVVRMLGLADVDRTVRVRSAQDLPTSCACCEPRVPVLRACLPAHTVARFFV